MALLNRSSAGMPSGRRHKAVNLYIAILMLLRDRQESRDAIRGLDRENAYVMKQSPCILCHNVNA